MALSLSLSVKVVRSTILKRPHAHAFQSGCHLQTTPIYVWFKCKFNEFRYSWYSPFCQRYYRNHLERKQPRLAIRRFSCILRRSDIYIWQPGWQLLFALWSQTVLNPQTHTLHRFNTNLYRIYEYVSIYHIVLSFWHKLFHFCSRMYACRHSWYSVGNGQFGLEGSEFLRLLGGSRHPFEQGCVRPAPSLKSGDDWMIDVFLGWFFEVENS